MAGSPTLYSALTGNRHVLLVAFGNFVETFLVYLCSPVCD